MRWTVTHFGNCACDCAFVSSCIYRTKYVLYPALKRIKLWIPIKRLPGVCAVSPALIERGFEMKNFVIALFVMFYSGAVMAATAVVQEVSGDVRASTANAAAIEVTKSSALESGMTVTTGGNGHIVMKFEDGEVVALNTNTTFKIDQYHFEPAKPEKNSVVFSLLKGAMRAVSGMIVKTNSDAFTLHTPSATIGIRGTDFMAATGSLYLQVLNGIVSATNPVGAATFTAGQTGFIGSLSALPTMISASQLPASVASSFSQLSSAAVTGGVGAAGGSAGGSAGTGTAGTGTAGVNAAGASVGGLGTTAAIGGAVAIGAAAAATLGNNNSTIGTTTVTQ